MTERYEIATRLKTLIFLLAPNVKAFSVEMGVSNSYLSQILKSERDVSGMVLRKIAQHRRRPNINWLLLGVGTPLLETGESTAGVAEPRSPYSAGEGVLENLLRRVQQLEKELAELKSLPGIAKGDG